jgi:RNA polymerase subunit RPABC4/transcription elongation factor Spt4
MKRCPSCSKNIPDENIVWFQRSVGRSTSRHGKCPECGKDQASDKWSEIETTVSLTADDASLVALVLDSVDSDILTEGLGFEDDDMERLNAILTRLRGEPSGLDLDEDEEHWDEQDEDNDG